MRQTNAGLSTHLRAASAARTMVPGLAVIDQYFDEVEHVLHSWSGSETITVTCLRCGPTSRGIDIDPVATALVRVRLNVLSAQDRLLRLCKQIVEGAVPSGDDKPEGGVLDEWTRADTAARIRGLHNGIHEVLDEPTVRVAVDTVWGICGCRDYAAPNPRRGSDSDKHREPGRTSCGESVLVFE